jgi:electron transport complex protein RnfG
MSTFSRSRTLYQGVLLGITALVASGALVVAAVVTKPQIEQAHEADLTTSLKAVLPGIAYDNDLLHDTVVIRHGVGSSSTTIYRARQKGQIVAVVYQIIGKGYGGEIAAVMGVDNAGHITSVSIVSHHETPGLGDKIEAAKSPWIKSFIGKGLDNLTEKQWHVRKDGGDFDQFSGATITPRGVVAAVKAGIDLYAANRDAMFSDAPAGASTQGSAGGSN